METRPNKSATEPANLSMMRTLGTLGYLCFFSVFLVVLFGAAAAYAGPTGEGGPLRLTVPCTFFLGSVTCSALLKAKARLFEQTAFRPKAVVLTGALALPLPILQAASTHVRGLDPLVLCSSFLCGATMVFLFACWDDLMGRIHIRSFSRTLSAATLGGNAVFLLVIPVSPPDHLCLVAAALLIAQSGLLLYLHRFVQNPDEANDSQADPAAEASSLDFRIKALFLTFNVAFGIATGLLIIGQPSLFPLTFALAMAELLTLLLALRKDPHIHDRYVLVLLRLCAALISICFLLTILTQPKAGMAFLVVLCATWQLFWVIDMGLLMGHNDKHHFAIPEHMATSRLLNNGGFLLGLVTTMALSTALPLENATRALAVLVVIAVIALTMVLLPVESRTSPDQAKRKQPTAPAATSEDVQRVCDALARTYRLSPRESEILPFLIKGRNAKHIANELVISEYTAKTHIYNIYKKLDVHSRNELLDLTDELEE